MKLGPCIACLLALLLLAAAPAVALRASAQDKPHKALVAHKARAGKAAPHKAASAAAAPGPSEARAPSVAKPAAAAPAAEAEAREDVKKEGGSEVKVLEFSGLDIEGQLKTPQMLYFLNRLRAEFARPRLPHRSFMPELQRGTREKVF
jgi:hypothetical protein